MGNDLWQSGFGACLPLHSFWKRVSNYFFIRSVNSLGTNGSWAILPSWTEFNTADHSIAKLASLGDSMRH